MKFTLSSDNLFSSAKKQADLMIVLMQPDASGSAKAATSKAEKTTQTGVQPVVEQAIKAGHFVAEKGKTLSLYQAAGWKA